MAFTKFSKPVFQARFLIPVFLFCFAFRSQASASLHIEGKLDTGNPVPPASDTLSKTATSGPLTGNLSDNYRFNGAADGVGASLIANYGQLSVQANGTASKTGASVLSGPGAFQAAISGNPVASFSDSIQITSGNLPNGAPAVFRFTLVLNSAITQDGVATAIVSGNLFASVPGGSGVQLNATTTSQTVSANLSVHIGDTINLTNGFFASGSVNVGALHPGQSDAWAISGPQGYATLTTYIDSLTAGASYVSTSETTYGTLGSTSAPQLTITHASNAIIISWPSASTGYQLQQNSTLNKNGWSNFTGSVNDDGTTKSVQIPLSAGNLFFRLKQ